MIKTFNIIQNGRVVNQILATDEWVSNNIPEGCTAREQSATEGVGYLYNTLDGTYSPETNNASATEMAAGKLRALTEARALREDILARLNGIHLDAIYNNDVPPVIAAIMVAKQDLKDITVYPSVVAAVDYETTKVAVLARYYEIANTLAASAPTAVSAFVGLDS